MPDKVREETHSIRDGLYEALKSHTKVQIYSAGTYRGIAGRVTSISHGMINLEGETEDGVPVKHYIRISDVKRLSVYGDGDR